MKWISGYHPSLVFLQSIILTMSASPQLPPIPPSIAKLTAPRLIGELIGAYLFGILTVQFYFYYLSFPRDAKHIKWLVYIVFLIDLASTTMSFADAYHWFAKGFGNLLALDDIYLSAFDTPLLGSLLAATGQCYYCYRLWMLNRKTLPIGILVVLIALAQVATGIYGAVRSLMVVTFSKALSTSLPNVYILNIGAAVGDVLIAATMTILLFKSRTRHAPTDFLLKRIINLTVETNLASCTFALLTIILFVGVPKTSYFTCTSIIRGKIYSNSLLLMLNNRKFMANNVSSIGESTSGDMTRSFPEFRAAQRTDLDSTTQDISLEFSPERTAATLKAQPEWA
ncbi:hypothetical protein C8J57DRAFT_664430 [Mycena rebaudengoi]|nr:hypothetical protein C8J57DRAFT_664430 [Mycena rebaudengoi]